MKTLSAIFAALLALSPVVVNAQATPMEMSEQDRSAIRSVIESQLAAFQRDDGATAFSFATPDIRERFRTPENFMAMVRTAYPPVYRPRSVEFNDIVDYQGVPTQKVIFIGPDGVPVMGLYPMQKQSDGHWGINGCFLFQINDRAT